jgi:hypothetical protein
VAPLLEAVCDAADELVHLVPLTPRMGCDVGDGQALGGHAKEHMGRACAPGRGHGSRARVTIAAMTTVAIKRFYAVAACLAAIAGALLIPLGEETDRFFSWDIAPPLSAAFLGAAYWAAFVLLAWAAGQRSWALARTAMPPVATIAALLLVTTLIHLDRFDLDSLFGWFWLVVYACVTPLLALLVVRQVRAAGPVERGATPLPRPLLAALVVQAVVLAIMGIALLVAPEDAAGVWPWELTPLTARAIGSFLVGFGVAGAFAAWEDDLARLRGVARAYAALAALELAVLALRSADVTGSGAQTGLYVAFWSVALGLGLVGALLPARSSAGTSDGSR